MIELALQPDFVDRWQIRIGVRVDDVWHNPLLPMWPVADLEGRGWRRHGVAMETRKCRSECCSPEATPDRARGRGRRLRRGAAPGACRRSCGCGLSPCPG